MTGRGKAAVVTSRGPRRRGTAPPYVGWALAGVLLASALLLLDVRASGHGITRPIRAGSRGPSAAIVARDFPKAAIPDEVGFDGQQFYAMARDPFHPHAVAPALDNPRYRYQRPLYPMLAWALHPAGGGPGLIFALVAVSLAGLLLGALALAALSVDIGGPPWLGVLYPLLPGSIWTVTSSVADGLAVSLSLATIVAARRGRLGWAVAAAIAAALTRETTLLVPIALLLCRRRKEDWPLLVVPVIVLAAWLTVVRLGVPGGGIPTEHPVLPLTGLVDAGRARWFHGRELLGMGATLSALVASVFVLVRKRGPSDLRWTLGVHLAFLSICSGGVLGDDYGSTRSTLLVLAVALAAMVSGTRTRPTAIPRPRSPAQSSYLPASTSARNLPV